MLYKSGASDLAGVLILAIAGLVIWGMLSLFGISFGVENEGIVQYDDCRQVITIRNDSWQKYFKQFTCTYRKTKSGAIMNGWCVHTENDGFLFGSGHTCATAYVYEYKQQTDKGGCTNPKYPYLGYDDNCFASPQ